MGLTVFTLMVNSSAQQVELPPPTPEPIDPRLLVSSEEYHDISGALAMLDAGTVSSQTENLFTPRLLYHNGKTYYVYMTYNVDPPYGQARLLVFDKDKGFDVPITVGNVMSLHPTQGIADSHQVPSMMIAEDPSDEIEKVYLSQERTHMTALEVYKDINGDQSQFTLPFYIGLNLAYANYLNKGDGNVAIWCRGGSTANSPGEYDDNHDYSIYVVDSTNGFEGLDTATPVRITSLADSDLWHYPGVPFGRYKVGSEYFLLISRRVGFGDSFPTTYYHKYALVITEDFNTYRNFENTFSHSVSGDGLITDTILFTNYQYHATTSANVQGRHPVAGLSHTGRFYAICGNEDGDGGFVFIYYDESGVVVKDISIPNLEARALDDPTNSFYSIMPYALNDIRVVVYITSGGFTRPHLFKTTDLGDSWTDLGDMCPEVADVDLRSLLPNNIMDIPVNTNFAIYFSRADAVDTGMRRLIYKTAAFNALQPITIAAVTPAVSMNYNSTGLFHYKCHSAGLTKTGNNVTALIDQFAVRNATCANNPQWNGSDAVTFLAASSQKATPASPANLVNKNALTFMCVCKFISGVSSHLLTFTNTANTTSFIQLRTAVANLHGTHPATAFVGIDKDASSEAVTVFGQDDIGDGEDHLITFVLDGRARTDIFIDGKRQFQEVSLTTPTIGEWDNIGKGPAFLTAFPANTVSIAARDRSTDDYTDLTFKEMLLYNGVLPEEERKSREKKLCDDYGITYRWAEQFITLE